MPREINVNMSYHTPHSIPLFMSYCTPHSIPLCFCIKFRFHYIRDVQGRQIVIASYPQQNPPSFPCAIHPSLMANPDPSLLCNYLHNFLNVLNPPNLNHTSRLYLSRNIANSLKSTLFPNFCQVTADVKIVERDLIPQRRLRHTVNGDVGESRVESGGTGASKLAMNMLMKKGRFQYHNNCAGEGEECSICWESYSEGSELIKMPCLHIFHKKCIFPWLKTKNSCPLCRQKV